MPLLYPYDQHMIFVQYTKSTHAIGKNQSRVLFYLERGKNSRSTFKLAGSSKYLPESLYEIHQGKIHTQ